ncbi:MAG: hypothetical protein NTX97_04850 [Bacteroidetes bacterium]|nr:hypothetical protein [Bacteroidota bacterium]
MNDLQPHTFHIPVMGLGYTIDTPLKVGKFGISSVISIIEDQLVEKMREFYSVKENIPFVPILESDVDHRSKRIKGYLNLMDILLKKQVQELRSQDFSEGSDIVKYFELLPNSTVLKEKYHLMLAAVGDLVQLILIL